MQVNSKSNPSVSVVIPVHNGERYISATIESVLIQSLSDFELIIVNDGSSDSTGKIISDYQAKDDRIVIVNQAKSGVSAARNSGLGIVRGKFISFLDSDDIWLKENLSVKINFLNQNPAAFGVTSFCELINSDGHKTGLLKKGDKRIVLQDVLAWKGNYITIPSGIVFKTDFLRQQGGFNVELSNNADQEIIMRLLNAGLDFHTLQEVTWYYRKHEDNMSSNIALMEKDTLKCYQLAIQNGYFKSGIFKNKCMSRMSLILAFSVWRYGNSKLRSLKWMLRSFMFSPVNFTGQIIDRIVNPENSYNKK